jgi:hypothetical protein
MTVMEAVSMEAVSEMGPGARRRNAAVLVEAQR